MRPALPTHRVPRKTNRRINAGRRKWPATDATKSMSGEDLNACIGRAQELSSKLFQDGNVANAKVVVADLQRLVGEVRRLRQLAIDAEPHVPDNAPTKDLRARLKVEVGRG